MIRLACSNTTDNNICGLVYMFTVIFSLTILILSSLNWHLIMVEECEHLNDAPE